ncbi:MAG: hypothetical protein AAF493_05590 [Pseudomonadota bacterium]
MDEHLELIRCSIALWGLADDVTVASGESTIEVRCGEETMIVTPPNPGAETYEWEFALAGRAIPCRSVSALLRTLREHLDPDHILMPAIIGLRVIDEDPA